VRFKGIVLVVFIAAAPAARARAQAGTVTAQQVIELFEVGASESILIEMIEVRGCRCDVPAAEIQRLRSLGASDALIRAILTAPVPSVSQPPAQPPLSLPATPPQAMPREAPNAHRTFEIMWSPYSFSFQGSDFYGHGGEFAFAARLQPDLAILADASLHRDTFGAATLDVTTYRFGVRAMRSHGERATSFIHVLAGGFHAAGTASGVVGGTVITATETVDGFSMAVGGGLDIGVRPWFGIRVAQGDYSLLYSGELGDSHGVRIGTGLVFRFGGS
jgi:hypothetical protein